MNGALDRQLSNGYNGICRHLFSIVDRDHLNFTNEQVFALGLVYTVVIQATRRGFVYRYDTYQGRP